MQLFSTVPKMKTVDLVGQACSMSDFEVMFGLMLDPADYCGIFHTSTVNDGSACLRTDGFQTRDGNG